MHSSTEGKRRDVTDEASDGGVCGGAGVRLRLRAGAGVACAGESVRRSGVRKTPESRWSDVLAMSLLAMVLLPVV